MSESISYGSPSAALQAAIEIVGSRTMLARALGVTPQAVSQWSRVPVERVLDVEAAVNGAVSRYALRPDIYGSAPEKGAEEAA